MHRMIIFDDGRGQLGPLTDLRASFEVRTGLLTTAGRVAAAAPKSLVGYWVPEPLSDVVRERANAPVNVLPNEEILYLVNGRWAVIDAQVKMKIGEAIVEQSSGHVAAALLRHADADYFLTTGQLHERVAVTQHEGRLLYRYPWDVIGLMQQTIPHDILATRMVNARIVTEEATVVGPHPVEVHASVAIFPQVIFDASRGPILVAENAVIRPGAILCGPCAVAHSSTVLDRALVKPFTVIGPFCKIAGEVGSTIFQGCSNKAHDGHLGDSWVGKWVNLGAGTTNSNLMNTYGSVAMRTEVDGPRHRTGLTFLGSVIGDHVKTAINTRLMTGTLLGTGAMVATTAAPPTTVARFAWLTDAGQRTYRLDKFLEVMKAMMARRDRTPSPGYTKAVVDLHRLHTQAQTE